MYVVKRKETFTETLRLEAPDGKTEDIIVKLQPNPALLKNFRALQIKMIDLETNKNHLAEETAIEERGKCVVDMFVLLFGQQATEKILAFYEYNYVEMLTDIFPFIQEVIIPRLNMVAKEIKQDFRSRFKK